ncbi:MAG TPA: LysM peptidoglycan-binding domain-containing protein, partial [Burkholderiaceae bacterium]|nr:LysM peptidoglycan-binding domain-containing protein [Burkholderiaceae bacterium]
IVGAAAPTILLPADRAETFRANLAAWEATGQPLASWTAYTLREGETLAQVAARVGVSEAQLREANRIPPRYRIAARSTILIPRDETMDEDIAPEKLAASFALVPEKSNYRQITYRVRRGDTLASVARRWGVRPDEIVAWNNLRGTELFAGQRLNLTVARGPTKTAKKPVRTSAAQRKSSVVRAPDGRGTTTRATPSAAARR